MFDKAFFISILGLITLPIEMILGTNSPLLSLLLIAMGLDIFSGVLKSIYMKTLYSKVGYKGFIKKIGIFVAIGISHIIDQSIGTEGTFKVLTITFYLMLECLSIIENLGAMDILIPNFMKEKLKQVYESTEMNRPKTPATPMTPILTVIPENEISEEEKQNEMINNDNKVI
jgi:toxin secretion/phage lysis holin